MSAFEKMVAVAKKYRREGMGLDNAAIYAINNELNDYEDIFELANEYGMIDDIKKELMFDTDLRARIVDAVVDDEAYDNFLSGN